MVCLLCFGFLVMICNTIINIFLFFLSFTLRYANIIPSRCFVLPLGGAFG